MNKIISITIISLIMLAVLISAVIININKDIKLTSEQKTKLTELSLDNYNVIDYEIGTGRIGRCLNKEKCWEELHEEFNETSNKTINISVEICDNVINSCQTFSTHYLNCAEYEILEDEEQGGCIAWEKLYYIEQEIINILDNWEEERIKLIANTKIGRDAQSEKIIIREGITTIK